MVVPLITDVIRFIRSYYNILKSAYILQKTQLITKYYKCKNRIKLNEQRHKASTARNKWIGSPQVLLESAVTLHACISNIYNRLPRKRRIRFG